MTGADQGHPGIQKKLDRILVDLLVGGKARLVNSIVDIMINATVNLADLRQPRNRRKISSYGADAIKGSIQHADNLA